MSAEATAKDRQTVAALGSESTLHSIAVLIPAWQPGPALVALTADLLQHDVGLVLVIDDGSDARSEPVFQALQALPRTRLLRHPLNSGKGSALKTGFRSLLELQGSLVGVVTADADGQHTPADVAAAGRMLLQSDGQAVLGTRRFDQTVPLRNRLGNILIRRLFRMVTGAALMDCQTGLRGLPLASLPALLALPGERYEYEMTMLLALCRRGHPPLQMPIQTIYGELAQQSHFRPFLDSARVCLAILGFYAPFSLRLRKPQL